MARIAAFADEFIAKPTIKAIVGLNKINLAPTSCDPVPIPSPLSASIKPCKGGITPISKDNFPKKCKEGIIIRKSGYYKLASNLSFSPNTERTTAITIAASNVVLDLGRFTLRQINTVPLTYGIAIARDVRNVKITGEKGVAEILDFTLAGIRVLGRTEEITIENVIVSQSEIRRLVNEQIPESCTDILCLRMTNGIVVGEGDTGYISFAGTDKANIVKDLTIKSVVAKRAIIGTHLEFIDGFKIINSTFTENSYYGLLLGPSWVVAGDEPNTLVFPQIINGFITGCHFDENYGITSSLSNPAETFIFDFLAGIAVQQAEAITLEKCTVNGNHTDSFILAADHDASKDIVWRNCEVRGNSTTGEGSPVCDGFHMSGSIAFSLGPCLGADYPFQQNINFLVENVVSTGNVSPVSGHNFRFAYSNKGRVKNCTAEGYEGGEGGIVAGFRCQGDIPGGEGIDIVFEDCVSQGNRSGAGGSCGGFYVSQNTTNVIIRNCISQDNFADGGNNSAGIFIRASAENGINKVVVDNCIITANGSDNSVNSGGIILSAATGVPLNNVLIQHNTLAYNVGDGIVSLAPVTGLVIKDNEVDQSTGLGIDVAAAIAPILVTKNIAYLNAEGNYNGVPPTNIVEAPVDNLPDTLTFKNLSIIAV